MSNELVLAYRRSLSLSLTAENSPNTEVELLALRVRQAPISIPHSSLHLRNHLTAHSLSWMPGKAPGQILLTQSPPPQGRLPPSTLAVSSAGTFARGRSCPDKHATRSVHLPVPCPHAPRSPACPSQCCGVANVAPGYGARVGRFQHCSKRPMGITLEQG